MTECEYCGQMLEGDTLCRCPEAVHAAAMEEKIANAQERVIQLFGDTAPDYGFAPIKSAEIIEKLQEAVVLIANDKIRSMVINIGAGTKATVTTSTNGKINVQRSQSRSYKLEE